MGGCSLSTQSLGLREFRGNADGHSRRPMPHAAVVIVAPLIVAFLLAQKRFVEGITLSGTKRGSAPPRTIHPLMGSPRNRQSPNQEVPDSWKDDDDPHAHGNAFALHHPDWSRTRRPSFRRDIRAGPALAGRRTRTSRWRSAPLASPTRTAPTPSCARRGDPGTALLDPEARRTRNDGRDLRRLRAADFREDGRACRLLGERHRDDVLIDLGRERRRAARGRLRPSTAEFPGPTAGGNAAMFASKDEDLVALDTA